MAIQSINIFKKFVNGIQRQNLFDIIINFTSVKTLASNLNNFNLADGIQTYTFTCKSSSFPQDSFNVVKVPLYCSNINFFGDRTTDNEWETNLIIDKDWYAYKILYNWHITMMGKDSLVASSANINDFKTNATITAYDIKGNKPIIAKMYGIFPSSIQQIEMAWDNDDSYAEVSVTWAFDSFVLTA